MAYYKTCPVCGAALDPGERCDCEEKAAHSATNTESGRVEQASGKLSYSAPIVPAEKGECQD